MTTRPTLAAASGRAPTVGTVRPLPPPGRQQASSQVELNTQDIRRPTGSSGRPGEHRKADARPRPPGCSRPLVVSRVPGWSWRRCRPCRCRAPDRCTSGRTRRPGLRPRRSINRTEAVFTSGTLTAAGVPVTVAASPLTKACATSATPRTAARSTPTGPAAAGVTHEHALWIWGISDSPPLRVT